ncbi:MAG TPA: type II toxin-antitoxin system Y4mF family antitoxin [Jatrophihabitans sp.]
MAMADQAKADVPGDALATAIRSRRRQLRLRQDEVADLAGVSERFVYALENGKQSVQLDKVVALLSAIGLHLELHRGGAREIRLGSELSADMVSA